MFDGGSYNGTISSQSFFFILFHHHIFVGVSCSQRFSIPNYKKFQIDKEHMFPDQKNGKTEEVKTEIEGRTGVKG